MTDPLNPPVSTLLKLASAVIHAEEFMSPHGHDFDKDSFDQQLADPEVRDWLDSMTAAGMAPVKRNSVR